jgi:hypothetical protein
MNPWLRLLIAFVIVCHGSIGTTVARYLLDLWEKSGFPLMAAARVCQRLRLGHQKGALLRASQGYEFYEFGEGARARSGIPASRHGTCRALEGGEPIELENGARAAMACQLARVARRSAARRACVFAVRRSLPLAAVTARPAGGGD